MENIDAFIKDIIEVYEKHNMSITRDDYRGGRLIIQKLYKSNVEDLKDALDETNL